MTYSLAFTPLQPSTSISPFDEPPAEALQLYSPLQPSTAIQLYILYTLQPSTTPLRAAEHQICASGTNDTVYVTTRHALATVAHRALRSDRFLTWQRPDSPISDVGAMQEGRVRKSLLQGGRWLEVCLRRRPSACGVAKLAAVKNRGPGRGKRPFQAWSALAAGATRGARPKGFRRFDESFGTRR